MDIQTIQTGSTLVSPAVPDRSARKCGIAYTGLFQRRRDRICVPVKCFYVTAGGHHVLIDAGWSKKAAVCPVRHLGVALWFASQPVMQECQAAAVQLAGRPVERILMTHLDCDHCSGLSDFSGVPVYAAEDEIAFARKKRLRYGRLAAAQHILPLTFCDDPAAPFGKSCDVFGDGSITAYLTPTHSKGSVIYKIAEGGRFALIVGDNGYTADSWEKSLLPGPLYHAQNMRHCLAWIQEQRGLPMCDGAFCAHAPEQEKKSLPPYVRHGNQFCTVDKPKSARGSGAWGKTTLFVAAAKAARSMVS